MSAKKFSNGILVFMEEHDNLIVKKIAEQYELDELELLEFVKTSLNEDKTIKSIKLSARKQKAKGAKKTGPISGFQQFAADNRKHIIDILKNNPSERKFKGKNGKTIIIDKAEFDKKGEPIFAHITRKCAAMWAELSEKEKLAYAEKAKENAKAKESEVQSTTVTTTKAKPATKASPKTSAKPKATPKKTAGKAQKIVVEDSTTEDSSSSTSEDSSTGETETSVSVSVSETGTSSISETQSGRKKGAGRK